MEKLWGFFGALVAVASLELCNGLPMDLLSRSSDPNTQLIGVLVAVMVSVCIIVALVGCVCCQRRQGFKVFRDSPLGTATVNETSLTGDDPGHVNPIATSEFTIFTPLSPPHLNNNVFRSQPNSFEDDAPPEVVPKLVTPQIDGIDVSSWFDGSQADFSRSKLKYIRELGTGWFGRIVEGEAQNIDPDQNGWIPVAVRILESSASVREQALFLNEANMYRTEPHPNILKLLGRSLEATPLLIIQEFYPQGDLKKFLIENRSNNHSALMTELPLKFCCQLASSIQYLHERNLPHLDLAARTCQINSEMNLKLGDYGQAVNQYPHDYYQGTPAIPVRWVAPEAVNHTNTTLQPKQVTCEGNIWSLGVTFWEICEWGCQPYDWLTDDEVVSQVMDSPHVRLALPKMHLFYIQPLYRLMQLCWQTKDTRPQISQVHSMLLHLLQAYQHYNTSTSPSKANNFPMEDFDSRWDTFKPNTIVKTDNQLSNSNNTQLTVTASSDKITDISSASSAGELFVQPEKHKSPSMTNLHGSLENLIMEGVETQNMDSWLQNVANHTTDMQYVRGLSQAIQALDSALASEQTSSSESSFERNNPLESLESTSSPYNQKIEFNLSPPSNYHTSPNPMDSILYSRRSESGSETEDETWKKRIERGAYSEKVRQKSKSVADLMVLTHIECSDTDSETPLQSLEYRINHKNVRYRPNSSLESASLMFGSEGNLLEVQDTFQEELKKLQEERRDSLLFVPVRHSSEIDFTVLENLDNFKRSAGVDNKPLAVEPTSLRFDLSSVPKEKPNTDFIIGEIYSTQFSDVSPGASKEKSEFSVFDHLTQETPTIVKDLEVLDVIKPNIIANDLSVDISPNKIVEQFSTEGIFIKPDNNESTVSVDQLNQTVQQCDNEAEPENEEEANDQTIQESKTLLDNCDTLTEDKPQININEEFIREEAKNFVIKISAEAEKTVQKKEIHDEVKELVAQISSEAEEEIKKEIREEVNHLITDIVAEAEESVLEMEKLDKDDVVESLNSQINTLESPVFDKDIPKGELNNLNLPDLIESTKDEIKQELQLVDNHIPSEKVGYSWIQNFINNERNIIPLEDKTLPMVPTSMPLEIIDNQPNTPISNPNLFEQLSESTPPQTGQMNQIYNVFSVQIDHKPPLEVFESPIKDLYSKPFGGAGLLHINDLLDNESNEKSIKSPEKLISQLGLVCTSSFSNDHLLNVLNSPLMNGLDEDLSHKLISNLTPDLIPSPKEQEVDDGSTIHSLSKLCETVLLTTPPKNGDNLFLQRNAGGEHLLLQKIFTKESPGMESPIVETPKSPKKLSDLASDALDQLSTFSNDANNKVPNSKKRLVMEPTLLSNNQVLKSPQKLTDIILDSLKNNSDYKSDKSNISSKLNDSVDQLIPTPTVVTSTPFKLGPNHMHDVPKEEIVSFVSEGDDATVILGPCDEYALGLYSGLKTTFEKYSDDDRPEEELLQFSSNFMPFTDSSQNNYFPNTVKEFDAKDSVDYSLDTWDKFLGKTLEDQTDEPHNLIFDTSPRQDIVINDKNQNEVLQKEKDDDDLTDEKEKVLSNITFTFDSNAADVTYTIPSEEPNSSLTDQESLSKNDEAVLNSWEPGEGWFLHPQIAPENLTGDIDISACENADDNSYVRFALDEECVNALRSELAAKLPHAQGSSHEENPEPEEWDTEERNEVIVKYNVYATPLSPIPEESCCEDIYCDQTQNREGSDSESEWSEPCLGRNSQLEEDILIVDTETHTAQLLESPSFREPPHRHTPSQDSCCSNDTLFNLEDLNNPIDSDTSPQHARNGEEGDEGVVGEDLEEPGSLTPTPKVAQTPEELQEFNSESTDLNLTYTKPDINIDDSENDLSNKENNTLTINSSPAMIEELDAPSTLKSNRLELKLEHNQFGVAPLPSPEDIPWKQIPASLLTYNEMVSQKETYEMQDSSETNTTTEINQISHQHQQQEDDESEDPTEEPASQQNITDDQVDDFSDSQKDPDMYNNLTDIRFNGPCDGQMMSTSFSESADFGDDRDWDSGSDTRSSSSGEFIWKEGEHEESLRALHAASHDLGVTEDINPMDAIEEESTNSTEESDDDCEEDLEETEFVPSAWDSQATPTKSALRSPEQSTKRKNPRKGVWFKKQKYHCVYEYPREPESPIPTTDIWRPLSDFSNFTDWDLDPDNCVPPYDETSVDCRDIGYDSVLDKFIQRSRYPLANSSIRHRDLYQLNSFPDFPQGTEDDFYISSSAKPFQTTQGSQFFPGGQPPKSKFIWQDYQSSSSQSSRDLSDNITPDSGIDDIGTPDTVLQLTSPNSRTVQPLKFLAAAAAKKSSTANDIKSQDSLGGLRHTRNKLKLDLPASPSALTATRSFTIEEANDPIVTREVPTFTTFGKSRFSVQHVQTPTDDESSSGSQGKSKLRNVSFEALPHKPMKVAPAVYIVNKPEDTEKQKQPIESVQGEASLLDSADEDSGIESSANATLERQISH